MDRVKRIWYLSHMRAAKVQASLRIRAVSPEPSLLAHKNSESRGTFRQKARSLASLNGWACAVKICHDGMLEDTNSLGGAHVMIQLETNQTVFLPKILSLRQRHFLQLATIILIYSVKLLKRLQHKIISRNNKLVTEKLEFRDTKRTTNKKHH